MKNSLHSRRYLKLLSIIASILIIYLIMLTIFITKDNSIIFPSPNLIFKQFFKLLGRFGTYKLILFTILRLLLSLIVSLFIGIALGILAYIFPLFRIFIKPFITILRCIPVVVLLIFFLMLSNIKLTPMLMVCFVLIPLFYEVTINGALNIDNELLDVWKVECGISFRGIFKILLPLIFNNIYQAVIEAIGLGFKVLIMGEYMTSSPNSVGNVIINSAHNLEYDLVYAWCIILVIIVLIIEFIPKFIKKKA